MKLFQRTDNRAAILSYHPKEAWTFAQRSYSRPSGETQSFVCLLPVLRVDRGEGKEGKDGWGGGREDKGQWGKSRRDGEHKKWSWALQLRGGPGLQAAGGYI